MPAKKYPLPLIKRASQITGKTEDTIRRWAKAGCNISDDNEVLSWSEAKGHAPKNVRPISPDDLKPTAPPRKQPKAAELAILDSLPAPKEEGAAAALKRLQGLELIFYSRLTSALTCPDRPDLIGIANSEYNKIAEALRKYEKEVELARRDLGHLIPKREAQDGARAAALWMRLGWRLWLSSAIPDLLPLADDPRAFKAKAEQTFSEVLAVALRNSQEAKLSIPDWAMPVIQEEFHIQ
jgi:hypothetical protein